MKQVRRITSNGKLLAYIIKAGINPKKTTFLTPPKLSQQVGFIVYSSGKKVARHLHRRIKRQLMDSLEVLIIKKGRCYLDIYNNKRKLVATCEIKNQDIILLISGGHGLRMLDDTILLEIKQGPYKGKSEKKFF